MNTTYILLHDGLITAVYADRSDLVTSLRDVLEMHHGLLYRLRKYTVYELHEQVAESGVFLNPKQLNITAILGWLVE